MVAKAGLGVKVAKKISKNELLFHSVHGLCRVTEVTKKAAATPAACSLRPVAQTRSNSRFMVPLDLLESSGFNRMVPVQDALEILEYLKNGKKKESAEGNAWTLAVTLRTEARSKEVLKDKRKAQQINQLVKSLANEIAIVLSFTVADARQKIRESLSPDSKINPLVLAALESYETVMI